MMTREGHARWYTDPVTKLPNIRRHPAAHEYQSPETVKRMVAGWVAGMEIETCPTCGQPVPTGTCDGNGNDDV